MAVYSEAQIDRYLDYIDIPAQFRRNANPAIDFDFLTALHEHQIAKLPYENLSLHYSKSRQPSLEPQTLYNKVTKNGRGGYCMENSIFFSHILRSLGFEVYSAGARIRLRKDGVPQGNYLGWVHMVNIVTLPSGAKYMVDVCFGGDGATKPLPLIDRQVTPNIGTQELRLVHGNIPEQTNTKQKLWIYEYRNGTEQEWNAFYCFPELEFTPNDFEVMNWFTSCNPDSFQRFTMLVVKFLKDKEGIFGKMMLVNEVVKENRGGKTKVVKTCMTEAERVEALKTYFGITLTLEEIEGIRGTPTELAKA